MNDIQATKESHSWRRCVRKMSGLSLLIKRRKDGLLVMLLRYLMFSVGEKEKIALLKNNLFVVRLFGYIQLKEFHESNIRIQQTWHNNNWSVIGKVAHNKEYTKHCTENKPKHSGS